MDLVAGAPQFLMLFQYDVEGRLRFARSRSAPLRCNAAPAMAQQLLVDDGAVPYTADQLARGPAAYARVCVACHGADLEGSQFGPTLKGEPFAGHWRGRTRAAFSEQVRSTMPARGEWDR